MNQFSEYDNYEFDGVRQLADHSLPSEQVPEKERDHVKQIFNEYAKNFIETRKKLFLIAPDNTLKKFASKKGINPPFSVKNGLYRILT